MAWNDTAPTKEELASLSTSNWENTPPTPEELQMTQASAPISPLESAGKGAINQFGLAPMVSGVVNSTPAVMNALTGTGSFSNILDAYRAARDSSKQKFKDAETANPMSYMAGNLAGGIVPGVLTGGASEAATAGEAAMNGAKVGMGYGALSGFGNSDADLTKGELGKTVEDTATGGASGALLGSLLGRLGYSIKGSTNKLDKGAAERAVKATGANKSQVKNLLTSPVANEDSENRLIEHGNNLLSKNPFQKKPIVTAFSGPEAILERAADLEQKSGKRIGDILTEFDSSYEDPMLRSGFYNPKNSIKKIKEIQNEFTQNGVEKAQELEKKSGKRLGDILNEFDASYEDPSVKPNFYNPATSLNKIKEISNELTKDGEVLPLYGSEYRKLQDVIDTVSKFGSEPVDFKTANYLKDVIGKTSYNNEGKLQDNILGQVRSIINGDIENAADTVAQSMGNDEYLATKELYKSAKDSQEVLPLYSAEYKKLQEAIDTISKFGKTPVNFQTANDIKGLISKTAYNNEGKLQDQLLGQVRGIINDDIESAADIVAQSTSNPDILDEYLKVKDLYRTSKDAQVASLGKTAGNMVNRDLGITDYMAAASGATVGGAPLAVSAGIGNKLLKSYGNSLLAVGQQGVSEAINKVANASGPVMGGALSTLTQIPTVKTGFQEDDGGESISAITTSLNNIPAEELGVFGKKLMNSGNDLASKLGNVLVYASEKDTVGRSALIYSLMQNPGYRQLISGYLNNSR